MEANNAFQRDYCEHAISRTIVPGSSRHIGRQLEETLRVARISGTDRVLEAGCGMGRFTLMLADRGVPVEPPIWSDARRYSVVIPVFNSAPIVGTTIEQTLAFFDRRGWRCEIIAVNDGSTDRSWEVLRESAHISTRVTAIDLTANHGQHAATWCGLARASGDFIVTLDDDLQYPPEEIARLIEKADEGHDLVCGRFRHAGAPARSLASWTVGLLDRWLFHRPEGFVFTSFRLMRRDVVVRLCDYRLRDPYLRGVLVRCAASPCNVWIKHQPRAVGRSGYNAIKIARFGLSMLRTYRELGRGGRGSSPPVIAIREVVGGGPRVSTAREPDVTLAGRETNPSCVERHSLPHRL
jgi:hypothetical protein